MNPSRTIDIGHLPRSGPGRSGFTLIELMVVLVIVGLLSAIAVPSFLRTTADARLESSANRLLLDIKSAKLEASRSRIRHFVHIPSITGKTWLRQAGPDDFTSWSAANAAGKLQTQGVDSLETGVVFGIAGKTVPSISIVGSGISTSIPSGGYGTPTIIAGDLEDCTDGVKYPAPSPAFPNRGWIAPTGFGTAGLIVACGGAISDLNLGILYLTAKRSKNVFAISYNHLHGLSNQVRLFKYDGSSWMEVQ